MILDSKSEPTPYENMLMVVGSLTNLKEIKMTFTNFVASAAAVANKALNNHIVPAAEKAAVNMDTVVIPVVAEKAAEGMASVAVYSYRVANKLANKALALTFAAQAARSQYAVKRLTAGN
jgi:hypothetical protein